MDAIVKICRALVRVQGITEHTLPSSWESCEGIAKKELFLAQIEKEDSRNLLDALVLLANQRENLQEMDKLRIYDLLGVLKVPAFGESQTKIDVINAQIMQLDQPELPMEQEEEEAAAPQMVPSAPEFELD